MHACYKYFVKLFKLVLYPQVKLQPGGEVKFLLVIRISRLKFWCVIVPLIASMAVASSAIPVPADSQELSHCEAYSVFKKSINSIKSKYRYKKKKNLPSNV